MTTFDNVVIGAGIVGSFAALQLAKKGRRVLVIEQFTLPHTRGSSHGASRLIRTWYKERFFASLMPDAFAMWKELEEETNTTVFINSGINLIGRPDNNREEKQNVLEFGSNQFLIVPHEEISSIYPMLVNISKEDEMFVDRTGGLLLANKAISAVHSMFQSLGGEIWDGCPVLDVIPGDVISIKTSKSVVQTKSLVVCAGAWTSEIFKNHISINDSLAPYLTPAAVKIFYWKQKEPKQFADSAWVFPPFKVISTGVYVFGSMEYPGLVKILKHGGTPCHHPDERDKVTYDAKLEDDVIEFIRDHLPSLELKPAIVETCLYTLTPDEIFIVDKLNGHENIVIGCGFSGTGFKTAPVIGKLLSELALGEKLSHDISNFRLSRFQNE